MVTSIWGMVRKSILSLLSLTLLEQASQAHQGAEVAGMTYKGRFSRMDTWDRQAPWDAEGKTLWRKGDTMITHWDGREKQSSWFPPILSQETGPKILKRLLK